VAVLEATRLNRKSEKIVYNHLLILPFPPFLFLSLFLPLHLKGPSGKAVRQYFPYVSSESDLQRYKAITFHKQPSTDTRASSSLSNMPSDSTRTKVNFLGIQPHVPASQLLNSNKLENRLKFHTLHVALKKKPSEMRRFENEFCAPFFASTVIFFLQRTPNTIVNPAKIDTNSKQKS
jgi:hypothetical protein